MTLRAIIVVGCVLAVSGMVLSACSNYYWQTVDFPFTPVIGIQVLTLPVAALLFAIRGETTKSRAARFFSVLGIGAPFATMFLFGHLCTWNALLDDSPPIEHRVDVLDAGRKARGQRRLEVPSWRAPGEREVLWISVGVADSPTLIVTTRAGALGYEWIDDVRAP